MKPFDKNYWDTNYAEPETIDGIGNLKDHTTYLKAFFELEGVKIKSLIDFGFGTGHLLKGMWRTFKPKHALGIEPSPFIFKKFRHTYIKSKQQDLITWACEQKKSSPIYDLGLCTSVLQYLDNKSLKIVLPTMARHTRYLYLTVPTDIEYKRQEQEHDFQDSAAQARSRQFYQKLLGKHFTFIGLRVLESKRFYSEHNSEFNDLLYRF